VCFLCRRPGHRTIPDREESEVHDGDVTYGESMQKNIRLGGVMADYSDDYGHPLQRHIERRMQETKERPQRGLEIEYRRGIIFKKSKHIYFIWDSDCTASSLDAK